MIKKSFSNKVIMTNLALTLLIGVSYLLRDPKYLKIKLYLRGMGFLGLTCSVINWFALHIMMEKVSFLFTADKLRDYMEPIKNFLVRDVFGTKNFDELKENVVDILTDDDKNKIEQSIQDLGLNKIMNAFDNDKMKDMVKNSVLNKIYEIGDTIKSKLTNGLNAEEKAKSGEQFFKEEILPIIENKLEMSVLDNTRNTIYNTIKGYFDWIVLWGGSCGALFGAAFRFIRAL